VVLLLHICSHYFGNFLVKMFQNRICISNGHLEGSSRRVNSKGSSRRVNSKLFNLNYLLKPAAYMVLMIVGKPVGYQISSNIFLNKRNRII
jgi:hypothetical protein